MRTIKSLGMKAVSSSNLSQLRSNVATATAASVSGSTITYHNDTVRQDSQIGVLETRHMSLVHILFHLFQFERFVYSQIRVKVNFCKIEIRILPLTMTKSNFCIQEREERDGGIDAGHVRLREDAEAAPRAPRGRDARVRAPVGGDGGQEEHAELGEAEEQGGEEGLGQEDPRLQLTEVRGEREAMSLAVAGGLVSCS